MAEYFWSAIELGLFIAALFAVGIGLMAILEWLVTRRDKGK